MISPFWYKDYFKIPRRLIQKLFVETKDRLTASQLSLMIIYIARADWDNRHRTFATTTISNRCLSRVVGFNKDKVGLDKKILWVKGYIDIIKEKDNHEIVMIKDPLDYYIDMKETSKKNNKKIF